MQIKFFDEPFVWIGIRCWPFSQTYSEANLWGKVVIVFPLIIAFIIWRGSCD